MQLASLFARPYKPALLLLLLGFVVAGCRGPDRPECDPSAQAGVQGAEAPDLTSTPLTSEQVQARWAGGPHAHSHEIDPVEEDSGCARCHAPESWDLAESNGGSSGVSDGEVSSVGIRAPAAQEWSPIGCAVCHPDGSSEIGWLENPSSFDYRSVATPSELCEKCHLAAEIEGHLSIVISGSHEDMECTDCHDPHDGAASCVDCHEPFAEECQPIETHDKPHRETSCSACHDASGLGIGWNEQDQVWDTVLPSTNAGGSVRPVSSHSLEREVLCERCHEPGNHPWGETKE